MTMGNGTLKDYLARHPTFEGLEANHVDLVAGYASVLQCRPGERIFQRDHEAHSFFIVRDGSVAIEVPSLEGESLKIQTVGDGSMLGWSWLIPPYRWSFDARAVAPTTVIAADGDKLRAVCDADPKLGYHLMKQFALLMAERLNAARLAAIRHYSSV